jgi:hypothetical protein
MEDGCQRLPSRRRAPRAVESGAGAHTPGSTTGGAVTKEPPTIRVRRAVPRQLAPEGGDASCGAENQKKIKKRATRGAESAGFARPSRTAQTSGPCDCGDYGDVPGRRLRVARTPPAAAQSQDPQQCRVKHRVKRYANLFSAL